MEIIFKQNSFLIICCLCALVLFLFSSNVNQRSRWFLPKQTLIRRVSKVTEEKVDCNLPLHLNPLDSSIKRFIKKLPNRIQCIGKSNDSYYYLYGAGQQGLTYVDNSGFLITQKTKLNLNCFYQSFDRKDGNDTQLEFGKSSALPSKLNLNQLKINFVSVTCSKRGKLVYKNIHFYPSTLKVENSNDTSLNNDNKTSVIILVLESLSRLNYLRFLHQTKEALESLGNGLTKIADNSYPNMAPLLTGLRPYKHEFPMNVNDDKGPYDELPLIWKLFQKEGYKTSFIEDLNEYTLFNYLANGFVKEPVDWYPRPYWLQIKDDHSFCYNFRPQVELLLQQKKLFLRKFKSYPLFAFSFYIQVTHNDFNNAQMIDSHYANFINEFKKQLNTSIFILMGDHGNRYGNVLTTFIGRVEERMPLFAIHLPEKLLKEQPHLREYLNINKNRLTTWLDVHTTLLDVVNANYSVVDTNKLQRSYSLWKQVVPTNRTCDQALIPETYCVCDKRVELNTNDSFVRNTSAFLVSQINELLSKYKNCQKLRLSNIISAFQIMPSNKVFEKFKKSKTYELT
ncbi:uncharacterized protein B4U80_00596, partial [Leptotrombidium deliense]